MGFWLVFLCLAPKILAASIKKELGTVFIYQNETFQANLNEYFEGNFLNFSVYNDETNDAYLLGDFDFGLNFAYSVEDFADSVLAVYTKYEVGTVICAKGMKVYVFSVNLVTGSVNFTFSLNIKSDLGQASIIDVGLGDNIAFLMVNGIEMELNGSEYRVNEIFYISLLVPQNYSKLSAWDIKYLESPSMFIEASSLLTFWGKLNDTDIIFIYKINTNYINLLYQITSCNILNSTQTHDLDILDLFLYQNQVYVLDKNFGLVVYQYYENVISNKIIPLIHDGQFIRFSKINYQAASLTDFAIVMDTGIVVINLIDFHIMNFIQLNNTADFQCQISSSYLFLYSSELGELEIIKIDDYVVSSLHLIPYPKDFGSAILIKDSVGYLVIKLIHNEIQIYSLAFTENILEVKCEGNLTIFVMASDDESYIGSFLHILIIEDLYSIYQISNFRATNPDLLNQNVYLDGLGYQAELSVSNYFSGWNYTTTIYSYRDLNFDYNITYYYPVTLAEEVKFVRNYTSGCFTGNIFTINPGGFYKNETLIIPDLNPKSVVKEYDSILILYPSYILFYDINKGIQHNKTFPSSCTSVFKSFFTYTFCSDTKILIIIENAKEKFAYLLSYITESDEIIDVTFIKNDVEIGNYLYLLTRTHAYLYIQINQSLKLIKKIVSDAKFITHGLMFLYIVGENILVYDFFLQGVFKIIPLPCIPTSIYNHRDVLYVQLIDEFYVFNGLAPIIQSLIFVKSLNNCEVLQSNVYSIFLLCQNSGIIYNERCGVRCYPQYTIRYTVANPSVINTGNLISIITAELNSPNSSFNQFITHNVNTYSLVLQFDQSSFSSNMFIIDYNKEVVLSLSNKFAGFNINYTLYLNNTKVESTNPWLTLSPRVINNNYLNLDGEKFKDHEYLRYTNIVLVLCELSILICEVDDTFESDAINTPKIIKIIGQDEYFPIDGTCTSIKYIATKDNLAAFLLVCHEYLEGSFYFDGRLSPISTRINYLVFIVLDTERFELNSLMRVGIDHNIDWIEIISSSLTSFAIICIDYLATVITEENANNNLYAYAGTWQGTLKLTKLQSINFSTLNLLRMRMTCADGIYISKPGNLGILYIYLTDKYYGIRILAITQEYGKLIGNVEYTDDIVISVGVCGNTLFVLTEWTDIDQYFIDSNYIPRFYTTFQPSYSTNYKGVSSVISCSSYYRPRYLAIYIYSVSDQCYQLRLIDLKTSIYASYIKFFTLTGNSNSYYKARSLFITEYMVTALGGKSAELFTFFISDLEITFPKLSNNEYEKMVKKWKGNSFELMIGYQNEYNHKNSSKYLVTRIGPDHDDDSDQDQNNFWWLWIIGSVILVILVVVSFLLYKKVIGNSRQKTEKVEMKDIVSFVGRKNPRMSMMSLDYSRDF